LFVVFHFILKSRYVLIRNVIFICFENYSLIDTEYRKMIFNYNNTPIYYEVQGQGPVIVILHGFLESSSMWQPLIATLSGKSKVIAIDLPGFGKSGCVDHTHTMEIMAEVVKSLLNHLAIEKAKIIGHSMGGYVALALIEICNEQVEELILLNSTSREDSEERKTNRNRALKIIDKNHVPYVQMAINNLFQENTHEKYFLEIEKLKTEALNFQKEGIIAAIKGMRDRKDRKNVLKNFKGKKTMACGIYDPLLSYEACKIEAFQTNCIFISLDGGHMSMVENIEDVKKICTLS
tara:strand:+ start:43258 stop:44133 length:876 start_codon:yes stop_codon:yes gene_type:complete